MKLKITKNDEEPLLSRSKINAEVEFDSAVPARKDIIQQLAGSISAEPDLVVVRKINSIFGANKANISAYLYKNKESRDKVEEKKVLAKTGFNMPKLEKKPVAAK